MRLLIAVLIFLGVSAFAVPQAHAIIFLPAVILIPIAKIVAVVIGGFSLPALGVGALFSKLFRKSIKRSMLVISLMLVFLAIVVAIVLKIYTPERPFF